MSNKDLLKGLSDEQLVKARSCKSTSELLELAKQEGVELSEEQLAAVSGGCGEEDNETVTCPICNSNKVGKRIGYDKNSRDYYIYTCRDCGYTWFVY